MENNSIFNQLETAVTVYGNAYPEEQSLFTYLSITLHEEQLLDIIKESNGRKIIFISKGDGYTYTFE